MARAFVGFAVGFAVLAVVLSAIERWRPDVLASRAPRRAVRTDFTYWLLTPVVSRAVTRLGALGAVLSLALVCRTDVPHVLAPRSVIAAQPAWLQVLEALVLADLVGYATHRWFHRGRLWRFHAVHHSSTRLNWISAVRTHPVNDLLGHLTRTLVLVPVGFNLRLFAVIAPLLTFHAVFLHANVPWTFGPLRFVIASPRFHRWHHARDAEAREKNFAGMFPWIDLLFGTYYLPHDRAPTVFGIDDEALPEGVVAQLRYPFRAARVVDRGQVRGADA